MTTSTTTPPVATLDRELNQTILAGHILDAFDRFYAHDCEMQENTEPPIVGKEANRKREEEFVNSIETFHGAELAASAVQGDVSFSEWTMDVTFKGGPRVNLAQVAVRHWKNGEVAKERFYYNKG